MNELDVVLSSRVRLARNYEDLPFDLGEKPDSAAMCVARTVQALRLEENAPVYDLVRLRDLTPLQRQGLAESRKISRDLMTHAAAAAVLLREEESLSIMMNEEDHLRIQAVSEGLNLADAAEKCFLSLQKLLHCVRNGCSTHYKYLLLLCALVEMIP